MKVLCPECNSANLIKNGLTWVARTKVQRYQCLDCGRITHKPTLIDDKEDNNG
jgi:transposase-like protein